MFSRVNYFVAVTVFTAGAEFFFAAATADDALEASTQDSANTVSIAITPDQTLDMAEAFYTEGRYAEARALLQPFKEADPDKIDVDRLAFLTALILVQEQNAPAAIDIFRSILARKPELARVRLELAVALFALKEDSAAAYHFRLALGSELPDDIKVAVQGYLKEIEDRRLFRIRLSGGLVPNSNINTGPNDTSVRLFGLVPFDLSEDARQTSGVGLSSSLSVTALPVLSRRWRMETTAAARVIDHERKQFDDVFMSVEAGPRFDGEKIKSSFLITASERYFGGEKITTTIGTRLVLTTPLAHRTRFSVRAGYAEADYHVSDDQDGPIYNAGVLLSHALSRQSYAGGGLQVTRQETDSEGLRNTQYSLSLFYSREFPFGMTVRVSPQYIYRPFDAATALTAPEIRVDRLYGLSLDFTKRDLSLYGFAPIFSYTYTHNTSTVDLFEYDQHRLNLGLTRMF